jgi:hypothetical protein
MKRILVAGVCAGAIVLLAACGSSTNHDTHSSASDTGAASKLSPAPPFPPSTTPLTAISQI